MIDFTGCTILIVDDITTNIDILVNGLEQEPYEIAVATDGPSAIELIPSIKPDIILLDIVMPGMSGYEVCKHLKSSHNFKHIPVIFLTALDQINNKNFGFEVGAVDYITKPFDICEVRSRVNTHLELSLSQKELTRHNEILDKRVKERTEALTNANQKLGELQIEIIMRLGLVTEMRDDSTGMHIQRIRNIVELISNKIGKSRDESALWGLASTMHDVGKVGIPDNILLKPGKLTVNEFEIIKTHTTIGAKILDKSEYELIQVARTIALNHHEKWNGTGYPNYLSKTEIPLCARITAIADVFDALLSKRPYKTAWELKKVLDFFEEYSGKDFDPKLVEILLASIPEIMKTREEYCVAESQDLMVYK